MRFCNSLIGSFVATKAANESKNAGELQSVDGYMNIALDKAEEYVNGTKQRSYRDAFIRGNNGTPAVTKNLNQRNIGPMLTDVLVTYIAADR